MFRILVAGQIFPVQETFPGAAGVKIVAGLSRSVTIDISWDELSRLDNEIKAARAAADEFADRGSPWTVEEILAREG